MASTRDQAVVDIIMNGAQAGNTMKELRMAVRALKAELEKLDPTTQEFVDASKKLAAVTAQLKEVTAAAKGTSGMFNQIKDDIKNTVKALSAYDLIKSSITAVWQGIKDAVRAQKEFQLSLSNLKAITGASKDDLKFYASAAKDVARQHGVMAKDVVEAYKLIGGAKSELLENRQALASVTEQAVLLSKASGLDLPESARRLTDALNQFNAPADEAGKFVAILAESSKLGAAEVPDLTDALLESGGAARAAKVQFSETSAILEAFADKGLKGSEAGTKLRNVLLNMTTVEVLPKKAIDALDAAGVNMQLLSDTTVPFQQRLEELSKIQGNTNAITEVFGKENFDAATILIDSRKRVEELSKALGKEGLNSAYEQMEANTDNLAGATERLSGQWDAAIQGEGTISKFFQSIVEGASNALIFIDNLDLAFKLMFNDIEDLEPVDLSKLIKFGTLENGQKIQKFLAPFETINDWDFQKGAAKFREQFVKDLVAQGEKAEEAGILFDQYVRERTDKWISGVKLRGEATKAEVKTNKEATKDNTKELEKIKKAHEELVEAINKLEQERLLNGLPAREREIKEVEFKYAELLKRAAGFGAERKRLEEMLRQDQAAINKKHDEEDLQAELESQESQILADRDFIQKKKDLQQEITSATASEEEKQKQAVAEGYDYLISQAQYYGLETTDLEKKKNEELARINKEYRDKENEELEKDQEKKVARQQEYLMFIQQQAQTLVDAMTQVNQNNRDAQEAADIKKIEVARDKELKNFQGTEEEKEQLEEKFDKQIADRKRKAWEANQKAARSQAITNGALAITNILATVPKFDFGISTGLLIAGAITTTAAQLKVIDSNPVPEFFEGGFTSRGNKHKVAGIVHQNEYVVPERLLSKPEVFDMVGAIELMRTGKRGFAEGGFTSQAPAPPVIIDRTVNSGQDMSEFRDFLGQLMYRLEHPVSPVLKFDNDAADGVTTLQNQNSLVTSDNGI